MARERCALPDCRIEISRAREYLALATGKDHKAGTASNDDEPSVFPPALYTEMTIAAAITACGEVTDDCRWRTWVFSDDRGSAEGEDDGSYLVPLTLSDVGGELHHEIPGFVGVAQERSEWCWIAAVDAQLSALTGVHLDQAKVAQLDLEKSRYDADKGPMLEFRAESCDGRRAERGPCARQSSAGTLLRLLGVGVAPSDEPSPKDRAGALRALRRSLERNVAVPILVQWETPDDTLDGHYLVVYGADFAPHPGGARSNVSIKLRVYDPEDGERRTMDSSVYAPPDSWGGVWYGLMGLIDPAKGPRPKLDPAVCAVLKQKDRPSVCPAAPAK